MSATQSHAWHQIQLQKVDIKFHTPVFKRLRADIDARLPELSS